VVSDGGADGMKRWMVWGSETFIHPAGARLGVLLLWFYFCAYIARDVRHPDEWCVLDFSLEDVHVGARGGDGGGRDGKGQERDDEGDEDFALH